MSQHYFCYKTKKREALIVREFQILGKKTHKIQNNHMHNNMGKTGSYKIRYSR